MIYKKNFLTSSLSKKTVTKIEKLYVLKRLKRMKHTLLKAILLNKWRRPTAITCTEKGERQTRQSTYVSKLTTHNAIHVVVVASRAPK